MPPVRGVSTRFIYHAYEGPEVQRDGFITILMDDKVFQIPPHEPYEMTADSNGRPLDHPSFYLYMLLQTYQGIYGLVEVDSERTRTGIVLNTEKAEVEAQNLLTRNRWQHIEAWVQAQLNERVKEGKSVLPPTGFVEESIKVLNIDLEARYRLRPVGWDWRPDPTRHVEGKGALGFLGGPGASQVQGTDAAEEVAVLRAENNSLNDRLARLESMIAQLVGGQQGQEEVQEEIVTKGSGRRR